MHGITDDDDDDDAPQQLPFWPRMEGEEGGRKGVHTYIRMYVFSRKPLDIHVQVRISAHRNRCTGLHKVCPEMHVCIRGRL